MFSVLRYKLIEFVIYIIMLFNIKIRVQMYNIVFMIKTSF